MWWVWGAGKRGLNFIVESEKTMLPNQAIEINYIWRGM